MMEEVVSGLFGDVNYYIVGEIDEQTISLLNAGGAKKDTYLSGKLIFFLNLKTYLLKLLSILSSVGGHFTHCAVSSESVSHVICDQCSNLEYGEAKDLFELPVVTSRWVTLSVKCRVKLPHSGFDPESSNFFSK